MKMLYGSCNNTVRTGIIEPHARTLELPLPVRIVNGIFVASEIVGAGKTGRV